MTTRGGWQAPVAAALGALGALAALLPAALLIAPTVDGVRVGVGAIAFALAALFAGHATGGGPARLVAIAGTLAIVAASPLARGGAADAIGRVLGALAGAGLAHAAAAAPGRLARALAPGLVAVGGAALMIALLAGLAALVPSSDGVGAGGGVLGLAAGGALALACGAAARPRHVALAAGVVALVATSLAGAAMAPHLIAHAGGGVLIGTFFLAVIAALIAAGCAGVGAWVVDATRPREPAGPGLAAARVEREGDALRGLPRRD